MAMRQRIQRISGKNDAGKQRITRQEVQQLKSAPINDLFETDDLQTQCGELVDNRCSARTYLLVRLNKERLVIDYDCWASFLEESDLYPTDLQLAIKELIAENSVKNMDADVSRRRTQLFQPSWRNKSERWVLYNY